MPITNKLNTMTMLLVPNMMVFADDPASGYGKSTDGGPISSVCAISPAVGRWVSPSSGVDEGGEGVFGVLTVGSVISVASVDTLSLLLG